MAVTLQPQPIPIPLDLKKELPDPLVPWQISDPLYKDLQWNDSNKLYKKALILPTSPEWRFLWRYFHHDKPIKYGFKRAYCVHERHQMQAFEVNLSSTERESEKFKATWDSELRADQRALAMKRWKEVTSVFSPIHSKEEDGRMRTWKFTKVLPLWHGSSNTKCNSICESGFVSFGKTTLEGKFDNSNSIDEGFFGSGIYFTNSARYAADIYSKGHLMLAWVSMREPFPVVGDLKQQDMAKLKGGTAFKDYNAHYVPVVPLASTPDCAVYYPCKKGQDPVCDEIVVFHKSQALPRFWIELEVEGLYLMNPSNVPLFVNELIPHILKILQNSYVDRDQDLRNVLCGELAILFKCKSGDYLEQKHETLFSQMAKLIDQTGKVDRTVRKALIDSQFTKEINPSLQLDKAPSKSLELKPSEMEGKVYSPPQANKSSSATSQPDKTSQSNPTLELPKQDVKTKIKDKNAIWKELKEIPMEKFLEAISQEPSNGVIYTNLGRILDKTESVTLLDGTKMAKKDLYVKAIALNPIDSIAYNNLGNILSLYETTVTLLDGTKMTQKDLYIKAIDLDPNYFLAYYDLGLNLSSNETVTLLDGTKMTKKDLYIKAIDLNPNYSCAYVSLDVFLSGTNEKEIILLNGVKMTLKDLKLKILALDQNSVAYFSLALFVPVNETITLLDGTKMTKRDLFLKSIDLRKSSLYYQSLAEILSSNETVTLLDGTKMTKRDLYIKAIDVDPNDYNVYYNLGKTISKNETVTLSNGTKMTQEDLYLKAINLDPKNSEAYLMLGISFPLKNTVQLLDGREMTMKDLFLKAIDLNPRDSEAYLRLGRELYKEPITLLNGTTMTNKDLFLKAIALNPANSKGYFWLALALSANETITLLHGTKMTAKNLYIKAIALDQYDALSYRNLAQILSSNETVTLLDGTKMKRNDLFIQVIALTPNDPNAYINLMEGLSLDETVTLLDGSKMTKKDLLVKVLSLTRDSFWSCYAYYTLGRIVSSKETVTLLNGTTMTKKDLYLKAIDLNLHDMAVGHPEAYVGLAETLSSLKQTVTLLDGTTMTKKDLYLKAIDCGPEYANTYLSFGKALYSDSITSFLFPTEITLLNGCVMTRKDFYIKAICLNPNNSEAYLSLGIILSKNETITLLDGTKMMEKDLYLEAISLNPHDSRAYRNLGSILSSNESVTLLDGTIMTKKDLILRADSIEHK